MWTKLCVRVELVRIGYGAATAVAPGTAVQRARGEHRTCTDAYGAVDECAGCTGCGRSTGGEERHTTRATRCGWGIDEWGMEEDTRIATYLGPGTVMSQRAACGGDVVLRRSQSILSMSPEGEGLNRVKGKNKPFAEILLCGQPQRAIGRRTRGERVTGNSLTQLQWPIESVESWRCWILHFSGSTGHGGESKERLRMSFTSLASHITIFELSWYIAEQ
ncbi:hypothetical protein B0H14DRAFT_2583275 [Mycena olivaceomarginata]|nr:hypothetical protein B0H14DRAFT_2583275 [Mycena olivaceomarginata]